MAEGVTVEMEPTQPTGQEKSPTPRESHRMDLIKTASSQGQEEILENSALDRLLTRYAKFIVGYPYVNIIIICIVFIWAVVIAFVPQLGAQKLPDFSKPTKGFEPRNTQLSNSKHAFKNLWSHYNGGKLVKKPTNMSARHRRSLDTLEQYCITSSYYRILNDVEGNKIIYEEKSGGNLLDVHNMKDVCSLQKRMMKSNSNYNSNIRLGKFGKECPSHSVPNYIAIVGNHSDCLQITSSDVLQFQAILKECVQPYKDGSLNQCLTNLACSNLTHTCKTHAKIVFNTFRFLSDSNFVNRPNNLKLTLVSERLNSPYDETVYQSIYNSGLKDLTTYIQGNVQVASFEFYGLKFKLFENRLFLEGALLSFAVLVVFVLIMVYSRSIFIGLMTFFCIIIAAVLAYFFYGIVYRLSFFPFLNVLTLIFLVGIGADDAFVYMGAWKEAMKLMPNGSNSVPTDSVLVQWTVYSLKHAIIAMFVTSFTTAAAFFASASSSIIAIRCFGIFAGTSILMNYLMMIFWFPVAVIISNKYLKKCCFGTKCCHKPMVSSRPETSNQGASVTLSRWQAFSNWFTQHLFQETIPSMVVKFRFIWIIFFALLGTGGVIVLFVSPKLRLPITKDFQMFSDASSIEQFPLRHKSHFPTDTLSMRLFFVFGVNSANTASMINPDDPGTLMFNKQFSITSKEEQIWLKTFCEKLHQSSFILKASTKHGTCHSILYLFQQLATPCNHSLASKPPCCGHVFPLAPSDFQHCFTTFLTKLPNVFPNENGPLFEDNKLRAMVIFADTRFQFSEAYNDANDFFVTVDSWFKPLKESAPESFRSAFWHSYLEFYDLQKSLASGTQVSLGISVAIAFAVVLFTTWNLLISIYTIVSIIFVISTSIGTLVLAGWRLNIMESIIFSVAAGLAVDFTLHYGVAYRSSPDKTSRAKRVNYSFTHLGSAVAMGAFTTFISGLVMSPATVLVYIQLSHFLMVLMTFSWIYANFFFMPLCSAIGPQNNFCQFDLIGLLSRRRGREKQNEDLNAHHMQSIST